jgi:UDP-N-acetylglucosamine transferase subunit ALG13
VIFVTVGTQLPFDRLISAVDGWAAVTGARDVFAQIGPSDLVPQHIEAQAFISPEECRRRMLEADAIVAHAGMGTILSALQIGKPIVVMPRRAALGEHRNDHQVATARRFGEFAGVLVAHDGGDLAARLGELDALQLGERISPYASPELISALSAFIGDGAPAALRPQAVRAGRLMTGADRVGGPRPL